MPRLARRKRRQDRISVSMCLAEPFFLNLGGFLGDGSHAHFWRSPSLRMMLSISDDEITGHCPDKTSINNAQRFLNLPDLNWMMGYRELPLTDITVSGQLSDDQLWPQCGYACSRNIKLDALAFALSGDI
jgi:hypothetical protein